MTTQELRQLVELQSAHEARLRSEYTHMPIACAAELIEAYTSLGTDTGCYIARSLNTSEEG